MQFFECVTGSNNKVWGYDHIAGVTTYYWGAIGRKLNTTTKNEAHKKINGKIRNKLAKGYVAVQYGYDVSTGNPISLNKKPVFQEEVEKPITLKPLSKKMRGSALSDFVDSSVPDMAW